MLKNLCKVLFTHTTVKALLASTAFVFWGVNSSFAFENKVKLSGFYEFQSVYYKNNGKTEQQLLSAHNKVFGFTNYSVVFLDYALIDDNENLYGAKISLEHTTVNDRSAPFHIYSESKLGRIEVGSDATAGKKMRINGYSASAAIGNGWAALVQLVPYVPGQTNRATAYITNFGSFFDEKNRITAKPDYARKITYYTPKMSLAEGHEVQFGASYIPDSANMGHDDVDTDNKTSPVSLIPYKFVVKNGVSYGAVYSGKFSQEWSGKFSYVGEVGKVVAFNKADDKISDVQFKNLNTYVVGGELTYNDVSISAAYTNYNKSLTAKSVDKISRDSYAYGFGVKYKLDKYAFSINQFNSSFKKNRLNITSLGAEWLVAKGFKTYMQTSLYQTNGKYLDASNIVQTEKSKGALVVLGAKVSF